MLLNRALPVRGFGAGESDSQVTWLQLVFSRFLMERGNNRQDCCQQAMIQAGNAVCGGNSVQSGCILSSCCAMMSNNANAAHSALQ